MRLERTTFATSRLLEFFTQRELTVQLGRPMHLWPITIIKELIDNGLDASETAGRPPEIEIGIGNESFSVKDNGPGIPENTLQSSLDYAIRVSDKTNYVSPTRGQLGNALKCVYAAPFVADGQEGKVEIETLGQRHSIRIALDRIEQVPALSMSKETTPDQGYTKVTVWWPDSSRLVELLKTTNSYNVQRLIRDYAIFNPHATFTLKAESITEPINSTIQATDTNWTKWRPDNPTSAYWYNTERLRNLIAAYLATERKGGRVLTVREFVSEFRGLTSSSKQKQVTEEAGLHGKSLSDLVEGDDVATKPVEKLLAAMQKHSKPVKASQLGVIGKEHIATRMAEFHQVEPGSIRYKKIVSQNREAPHVLEMALGIYRDTSRERCSIATGLNWAPTLDIPIPEFARMLGEMRIDSSDPLCVVMHIARPRFDYTDRGKGTIAV